MDGLDQVPAQYQPIAGFIFALIIAIGSAVMFLRGRREGAPKPKVQEFYASGQISDMGPVKELVEGVGLLFQQQVRTNIAIERCAGALEQAAAAYAGEIKAQREEAEIAAEVDRRVNQQLREQRSRARRKTAKSPAP